MFIPGRIEVLGKHTDYCGGRSIVCAIDRGFHAETEPRGDRLIVLENRDSRETATIDLGDNAAGCVRWAKYAAEVGARLTANFGELSGCRIRFESALPIAAGLSSSSALMIMTFAALDAANGLRQRDEFVENIHNETDLAEYLGCIENGQSFRGLAGSAGVGTFGGSQDHAAIMFGKPGFLSEFTFAPLRHENDLQFPAEYAFVVGFCGVSAEKTGEAQGPYNRLSAMVSTVTSAFGGQRSLADLIEDDGLDAVLRKVSGIRSRYSTKELAGRVEQFRIESFEIIPAVREMLLEERSSDIGVPIDLSQELAERYLGNQIAETSFLQRSAREIGAVAASAFGAGFGGSVYAIVKSSDADELLREWRRVYLDRYPNYKHGAQFFLTRPSAISLV